MSASDLPPGIMQLHGTVNIVDMYDQPFRPLPIFIPAAGVLHWKPFPNLDKITLPDGTSKSGAWVVTVGSLGSVSHVYVIENETEIQAEWARASGS